MPVGVTGKPQEIESPLRVESVRWILRTADIR